MMFHTRIKTNVLDRIILKDDDIATIVKVIEKHLGNASSEHVAEIAKTELSINMDKGLITITKDDENYEVHYYYELKGKGIVIAELEGDEMTFKITYTPDENLQLVASNLIVYSSSYKKQGVVFKGILEEKGRAICGLVSNFFRYAQIMGYLKEKNSITVIRSKVNNGTKGMTKKERQREARKRVSVSQDKKAYDYSDTQQDSTARIYERQVESWGVKGHWRHYKKSDKRVFIESYKKGNGERKGKDFTV